jgi:DNA-binding CsgD family transcriptional regulator
MPKQTIPQDFEALKQFVITLFHTLPGEGVIPEATQQHEVRLLQQSLGSGRFFFVVDLVNFEITECYGPNRWLGYSEKEFSLKQYWNIIHPGKQKALIAIAVQLYQALCTGHFQLEFMVQRYGSKIALKHYDGHYLVFQKISSVFQYDRQNRLTHYMNEFILLGKYEDYPEPLRPVFFSAMGDEEIERGGEILKRTIEQFVSMKVFSHNEMQVARMLAYDPLLRQADIAKNLNLSPHTIDTYCKRFLLKARTYFHHNFNSVTEAAVHLRKEGLV